MEPVTLLRTEEQLYQLALARDLAALDDIHQRWGSALFGAAMRFTGSNEQAEALLTNTFCRFWKEVPRYDRSKGRVSRTSWPS